MAAPPFGATDEDDDDEDDDVDVDDELGKGDEPPPLSALVNDLLKRVYEAPFQ